LLGIVSADLREPFEMREVIARRRRLPVHGLEAALRANAGDGLGVDPWLPGRHPGEQRRPVLGGVREGDPVHPAREPPRRALVFLQNITGYMVSRDYAEEGQ
jgi:hypothetical protein